MGEECFECGSTVYTDEIVWLNPDTGKADSDWGYPFHVECGPNEKDYDDL